jgi:glycosyltransferase involved in cell wall biosynthesis
MFSFSEKKSDWSYWLTYKLARNIIVVSKRTKDYMVEHENVRENKISVIRLAYNFDLYPAVNTEFVRSLRKSIGVKVVLITVGQFIPIKRPDVSIRILKRILENGIDAKLILLGRGEMESICRELAHDLKIAERVIFPGHVDNVLDYVSASTVLLHPSISESSCVVVKEAGLVDKPVIACKGVGDFDEYIEHGMNGFLVNSDNFEEGSIEIILSHFNEEGILMPKSLRSDILRLFSIESIIPLYSNLNH